MIAEEQQLTKEVPVGKAEEISDDEGDAKKLSAPAKTRKISTAVYRGSDGHPLEPKTVANIKMFQPTVGEKKTGFIDVWWLFDDGGLTLLLPYIFTTRKMYKGCKLRVFSLANRSDQLDKETRQMATLLAKFRIDYSDVIVIPDIGKKAEPSTKEEFAEIINGMDIDQSELQAEKDKTNRFVHC